jgi:HSP20 family molecular chaperone IbpA
MQTDAAYLIDADVPGVPKDAVKVGLGLVISTLPCCCRPLRRLGVLQLPASYFYLFLHLQDLVMLGTRNRHQLLNCSAANTIYQHRWSDHLLQVSIEGKNVLSLTIDMPESTPQDSSDQDAGAKWHCRERSAPFSNRQIRLPHHVDAATAAASMVNGVLHILVPKTESAKKRRINVV